MRENSEYNGEALLERLDSGIVHLDRTGKVVLMNRRAEEILRVGREDVVGRRVDMLPLRTPVYRVLSEDSHDAPLEMSIEGAAQPYPGNGRPGPALRTARRDPGAA